MLDRLESERPGVKTSILAALQNVRPTHLLDQRLWRALGLRDADTEDSEAARPVSAAQLVRG
jgi:tRNA 2-thiocytidine biosynthesis protein TtcA